jgi:hypothetical protein
MLACILYWATASTVIATKTASKQGRATAGTEGIIYYVQYDIHLGFSAAVSPVGSIAALRFVFHPCLLPPLVNNHTARA